MKYFFARKSYSLADQDFPRISFYRNQLRRSNFQNEFDTGYEALTEQKIFNPNSCPTRYRILSRQVL